MQSSGRSSPLTVIGIPACTVAAHYHTHHRCPNIHGGTGAVSPRPSNNFTRDKRVFEPSPAKPGEFFTGFVNTGEGVGLLLRPGFVLLWFLFAIEPPEPCINP